MHSIQRPLLAIFVLLLCSTTLFADIRLPKIFSDNMVLQQGGPIQVWGTADSSEELTITLGENSVTTTASEDGAWAIQIDAPPAGGPYQLSIAGKESSVVFSEVLVGEVWLCSGQSNMQWPLKQSVDFESDEAREEYMSQISMPNLRLFTVPAYAIDKPVSDFAEAVMWEKCGPENIAEFSATAYFFAKALRENEKLKDVPIGLIDSSWGGTPGESWTSRSSMDAVESLSPLLKHWDENENTGSPHRPASLFNGMIAPMAPMSFRGVIWYQGESNVGRARQYETILKTLINDWRTRFQKDDLPFYYVQLAPFRYNNKDPKALAELWDAQRKVLALPNTAIAASADIGNETDIHPKNKEVVGERLAKLALAHLYEVPEVNWTGPMFDSSAIDGSEVELTFTHSEGLQMKESKASGFIICGEDKEFKPAKAKLVDGKVVVWNDEVKSPVAVRYLWDDTAKPTLFNAADLPALPFRTDEFELMSAGIDF